MASTAIPAVPVAAPRLRLPSARWLALAAVAVAVFAPLGLVLYQSFLSAPFFSRTVHTTLSAYSFVLGNAQFRRAFGTSLLVSAGMVAIAVPLGSALAFLLVRTDLPGRRALEPLALVPIFLSPIVLAFGYVVAAGPVGFFSLWAKSSVGRGAG